MPLKATRITSLVFPPVAGEYPFPSTTHLAVAVVLPAAVALSYEVVLNSDSEEHGGFKRIDDSRQYLATQEPWDNRPAQMKVSTSPLLQLYHRCRSFTSQLETAAGVHPLQDRFGVCEGLKVRRLQGRPLSLAFTLETVNVQLLVETHVTMYFNRHKEFRPVNTKHKRKGIAGFRRGNEGSLAAGGLHSGAKQYQPVHGPLSKRIVASKRIVLILVLLHRLAR